MNYGHVDDTEAPPPCTVCGGSLLVLKDARCSTTWEASKTWEIWGCLECQFLNEFEFVRPRTPDA